MISRWHGDSASLPGAGRPVQDSLRSGEPDAERRHEAAAPPASAVEHFAGKLAFEPTAPTCTTR
jgi:hypothetical protein